MSPVEAFIGFFQQNHLGQSTRETCMKIDQELHKNQSEVKESGYSASLAANENCPILANKNGASGCGRIFGRSCGVGF
jgi:hypothetical protein